MSKLLEDSNGNLSSKRVAGYGCLGAGILMLIIGGFVSMKWKLEDTLTFIEVGKVLCLTGGGLLGIGVAEFFGKKS